MFDIFRLYICLIFFNIKMLPKLFIFQQNHISEVHIYSLVVSFSLFKMSEPFMYHLSYFSQVIHSPFLFVFVFSGYIKIQQ